MDFENPFQVKSSWLATGLVIAAGFAVAVGCLEGQVGLTGVVAGRHAAAVRRVWTMFGLWLAACVPGEAPPPVQVGPAQPRVVEVTEARLAPHPRTLTLSGSLSALEKVQVAARVEGPITEVRVDLGDTVVVDQVLAAIRPVDYRARVSELEASATQAQNDLQRALALGSAGTAEEVEQARTRVAEARAQRTMASRQLGDTTVRAPFAGAIAARHAAQGTYVKAGTALFDIVATAQLRLTIEVPERYAAVVVIGTPVKVMLRDAVGASAGKVEVDASITRVSPVVAPATRTFTAEAVFSPAGSVLKPGMFVVGELALGNEEGSVRVPRSAVFHVLGRDRVMRVSDGLALPQDVDLIAEVEAEAVLVGLPPGTPVISRGAALVAPGTPVVPEVAK